MAVQCGPVGGAAGGDYVADHRGRRCHRNGAGTRRLIAEIHGSTGTLVLNAPQRRNALSLDMWQGIPEIVGRFEADPTDDVTSALVHGTVDGDGCDAACQLVLDDPAWTAGKAIRMGEAMARSA